ncbi:TPA: hypothetical protein N0F65_005770 [Lagenidium giganteum]|uniref:Integrator complex subunit 6-like beta-barrel domain-containing protein n=1 Tax=Lagenidium giganteum TaxID=4803 RepID=A0AAV2YNZ9_9STRA|nr:TPA: hypothetical protein N0F65_005770 [Lagenidium giganteum]
MNQSTSSGMTLLDYAKSAVERFVKRVRDPSRRYQHHFMLVSCGQDNNGRVRVGWDQSTNKDAFLSELKNLRATDLSDVGGALKQAFELMNQIRLQFNWDNYGLGRTPWNTNMGVCILLTDATSLSTLDGLVQESLVIPPSTAVGAELTMEPYRWDQRLFTIALKLSATVNAGKSQPACPTDLMALSEATGGMLFMPTSKSSVEQSIDQVILKLKSGAVIKLKCDSAEGEGEFPVTRNTISPIPSGKEYCWPLAEAFWLDRNTVSLPQREAHPTLVYRRTVETAIEAATNHMLMDTLKFPADNYVLESSINPTPPRGQRWMVYIPGSKGDGRMGDAVGFLRVGSSGNSSNAMLVVLPYNYPMLFTLLVEAARVYQASGQNINSSSGTWAFQAKAMPSSWRENFTNYISGCPLYYYAPLKKILRKYNLHDMVPDVQDSGRSYQISNYLSRLRERSIEESESNTKLYARPNRADSAAGDASPSASPLPTRDSNTTSNPALDALAGMSLKDLKDAHKKNKRMFFDKPAAPQFQLSLPRLRVPQEDTILKLAPSWRATEEDEKHCQPIDVMSDYESRLIKKEALRNPRGDPEPDEDTPAGLRRRQLCFNLGNPYRKNSSKQQVSNVYQGEAADEAATLGGQSPKRQRTRKRSSQLKRDKKQAKRQHRSPTASQSSPGSPSRPPSTSGGSSTTSSPVHSDGGDSIMSDTSVGSNYSVKAETAQLLGVPLQEGDSSVGQSESFVRVVYKVLVENWETWSAVLRLIKSRTISADEEAFILNSVQAMKGGDVVAQTYVRQSIEHAKQFKKQKLVTALEKILEQLTSSNNLVQAPEDEDAQRGLELER